MIKLVPGLFHKEQETKQALANFILSTDQLSFGPRCEQFEHEFAAWQGRRDCVLFNSGSSANLALIQSLLNLKRIPPDATTAFSAVTWATSVMPLMQLGLTPIPVDIELATLNCSSQTLEQTLATHPDTKLFFLTNLIGLCGDIDTIAQICQAKDIILIEDNCESLGTVYQGRKLGNWGLASTFSFYVGHHFSTIEGGAVCTDDTELARMLRLVRAHGWDRNVPAHEQAQLRQEHNITDEVQAKFTFYVPGYNLRPTEITGFLGSAQLSQLPTIAKDRQQNFDRFQEAIRPNPDIVDLVVDHIDLVSSFAMPLVFRSKTTYEHYRDQFTAADVEIRPLAGGAIHHQPFYQQRYSSVRSLPNADHINAHSFWFGNHAGLTEDDLRLLCQLCQTPVPAHSEPAAITHGTT